MNPFRDRPDFAPVTSAVFGPPPSPTAAVPRVERITVTITLADGQTAVIDIPQPMGAGLDYHYEHGMCLHNRSRWLSAARWPCDCQAEQELVLAVQLDPWRDNDQPAYTITTQQTPERGST